MQIVPRSDKINPRNYRVVHCLLETQHFLYLMVQSENIYAHNTFSILVNPSL